MRNLKRALSLALATVMTLGLMVVGTGAVGYDDVTSEDNQEAIEVLQAVGIMTGVSEDEFNPDGLVTRNQIAVIMANLLNLDYDYYRGINPFTDVPSWAAPYVAACVAEGVTAGIGDNLYGGEYNVTAAQAALMLMKALGYFQYQGDFDPDWQVATIRQASYINLFDQVDANAEQALTRGQVAQMVLNALKANMVTFTGDVGITVNDVTVGYRAEYTARTNAANKYNSIDTGTTTILADNGQYFVQLGEELYEGDLVLRNSEDAFGRPARYWEYDGDEIGTYVKHELLRGEYNDKVTGRMLYDLLGRATIEDNEYDFAIYIDGEYEEDVLNGNSGDYDNTPTHDSFYFTKGNLVRGNTNTLGGTGKGVLTQVYVDTSAKEVTIAITNTYLAVVDGDYDEKADELDLDIYALEDVGAAPAKVYVKNAHDDTAANDPFVVDETVSGEDFDIAGYVDEDIVLVTVAEGEVQTIVDPEILDAVTLNAFKLGSYVEMDGAEYNYASTIVYDPAVLDNYTGNGTINLKDITYNLILDAYGNLIGIEQNEDPDQYLFLSGIDSNASSLGVRTADANVIFLDGTMAKVEVDLRDSKDADGTAFTVPGNIGNGYMNTWCTYTVDNDGVYTLTKVVDGSAFNSNSHKAGQARYYHNADVASSTSWYTIDTRHPALAGVERDDNGSAPTIPAGAFAWVYGNDDSVYIAVEVEGVTSPFGGTVGIITDVDSVVTGIDNANLDVYDATEATRLMSGATPYTQGVYTLFDDDAYVIAAIVVGEDAGATTSYAYVTSSNVNYERYDGEWAWTREVVINGELTDITYVGDALDEIGNTATTGAMYQGSWYEVKYYADGTVKSTTALTTDGTPVEYNRGTAGTPFQGAVTDIGNGMDTVLLENENPGALSLRGSMLYTATADEQGIYIGSDVKVVRAQAIGGQVFDEIEEYDGVDGLKDAIDDMYGNFATTGDYALVSGQHHELIMIIEDGRATSVILVNNSNKPVDGGSTTPIDGDLTVMNLTYDATTSHTFTATIGTPVAFGTCSWTLEVRQGGYLVASASSPSAAGANQNDVFTLSTNAVAASLQNSISGEYTVTITINDGTQILTGENTFTIDQ